MNVRHLRDDRLRSSVGRNRHSLILCRRRAEENNRRTIRQPAWIPFIPRIGGQASRIRRVQLLYPDIALSAMATVPCVHDASTVRRKGRVVLSSGSAGEKTS